MNVFGVGGISSEGGCVVSDLKEFLNALTNTFILAPDLFFFHSLPPDSLSEQTRRASSEEEERPTGGGSGGL